MNVPMVMDEPHAAEDARDNLASGKVSLGIERATVSHNPPN
jgi:hypothetical protein